RRERPREPRYAGGQSAPQRADRPRGPPLSLGQQLWIHHRNPGAGGVLVLAKRIIVVSADKAYGRQLATALKAAGGTVDIHASIDELGKADLQAALLCLHLDGPLASAAAEVVPRLSGDARVICVLPRSNLPALVDV